jgi:hypothetical protein
MKRKLSILITFLLLSYADSIACDCGYLGGFALCNQIADLVVYGKVIGYDSIGTYDQPDNPYSMKFEIIEKIRGIESRKILIVFGDNGADCRPYINEFKPNSEWILALNNFNGDYEISDCGEFYLPVKNGKVEGQIFGRGRTFDDKNYSYSILRNVVNNPQDYPLYKGKKVIRKDNTGLEYLTDCDQWPKCSMTASEIDKIINKKIQLPTGFMSSNDSYLIHAQVIITSTGKYKFNGLYESNSNTIWGLDNIEKQVDSILQNITSWESGSDAGKPVTAQILIPVLLKK